MYRRFCRKYCYTSVWHRADSTAHPVWGGSLGGSLLPLPPTLTSSFSITSCFLGFISLSGFLAKSSFSLIPTFVREKWRSRWDFHAKQVQLPLYCALFIIVFFSWSSHFLQALVIVWETIYYVFYIILLCSCFFGAYSLISSFKVRYSADLGPFLRFLMDARETKKKTEENNPLKFFFDIF